MASQLMTGPLMMGGRPDDGDARTIMPAGNGRFGAWRARLQAAVESAPVQRFIIALIVLNAATLGLETWPAAMQAAGGVILAADRLMLVIFTIEITARLLAHGPRFFRDPWSVFDFLVIAIAWVPTTQGFAVLRALRVLRVLRVVSAVPRMRAVVQALLAAVPGISSIIALLALIFYVAAVMATKLFGAAFPDWFGSIPKSLFSLFQIMTLESWSMGIVRPVMAEFSFAWAFFVPFILVATFTILNLFIAVVVSAMQSQHDADRAAEEGRAHSEREVILAELRRLAENVARLEQRLSPAPAADTGQPDGKR